MHITCITPYIRLMHVWMYKTYCTYVPSLPALSVQIDLILKGSSHTLSRASAGAPADSSAATVLWRPSTAATCRPVVSGSVSLTYLSEAACHANGNQPRCRWRACARLERMGEEARAP